MAALLTLNEAYRSDVYLLNSRLAHSPESVVSSTLDEVIDRLGKGPTESTSPDARIILSEVSAPRIGKRLELLEEYHATGVHVMTPWDADYPAGLRPLDNPPLVLFAQGRGFPGVKPIAIVGTRQASAGGVAEAYRFGSEISKEGRTIVSGMALGVDTGAHKGALQGVGSTIAVLAGHLGHVYPSANQDLYDEIVAKGSIVSEISPFGTVHRGRWIERNRITSGLSEAVVVVEFHGTGGTLQQARFAVAQAKPLFVVSSRHISDSRAKHGESILVEMGATPVDDPADVVRMLCSEKGTASDRPSHKRSQQSNLDSIQR